MPAGGRLGAHSLNFLRGMETWEQMPNTAPDSCFLNFLRGMETDPDRLRVVVSAGFLNFLRGMETMILAQSSIWTDMLPKLP